jgi:hypothetical protein
LSARHHLERRCHDFCHWLLCPCKVGSLSRGITATRPLSDTSPGSRDRGSCFLLIVRWKTADKCEAGANPISYYSVVFYSKANGNQPMQSELCYFAALCSPQLQIVHAGQGCRSLSFVDGLQPGMRSRAFLTRVIRALGDRTTVLSAWPQHSRLSRRSRPS